jgi:hypothetical protein
MNLSEWLDEIMPTFGGAEVPFVQRHIIAGAIDFCEQSWAWHQDADAQDVIVDQSKYTLVSPEDDTEIVKVLRVYVDNKPIDVSSWDVIESNYALAKTLTGNAISYVQDYADDLTLFKIPDLGITDGLTYHVALRPVRNATVINDSVGSNYYDAIADAIKARLYEIPKKPWSDGAAAVFHKSKFETAAISAKNEMIGGLGRGVSRVKLWR